METETETNKEENAHSKEHIKDIIAYPNAILGIVKEQTEEITKSCHTIRNMLNNPLDAFEPNELESELDNIEFYVDFLNRMAIRETKEAEK